MVSLTLPGTFFIGFFEGGLTIWKLGHGRGPGVSRGPHEMPLVPFFIGFFEFGQGHRGPMIPYFPGAP
ncbi:unnamed protein product [Staurois parvus]|uniref:Uncharacterized protein n=1 Tax=Staurois parvus TaxID=386267 RepID=A0ABN9ETV2_9NEOB|nr:unnamed protein product [Staurois parvus]